MKVNSDASGTELYPKCSVVVNNVCTACDSGFSLGGGSSSSKCCGSSSLNHYYDEISKSCKLISSNCE